LQRIKKFNKKFNCCAFIHRVQRHEQPMNYEAKICSTEGVK